MDRQYSMDADDLPLIMELFGDGGELDALVVDQQQQPQQQQPSEAFSHAVPEMGGRRSSEDASGAHGHTAQYQQLAALQQQLQILQGMVQQQMQSLSHAQPDGMRQTLLTMQGLLSTTQQQQAAQQQQLQQLQQFQHQQQQHHQHHQHHQQQHQHQHQQEQQQQQQPLGAAPAHAHSQPLMSDFSQAPGVIPHGYSAPELARPPSTMAAAAEQPQQQPQAQQQPQPPPQPPQPGIGGNPAKPGQDQQQHEKRRSGPEPSSKPARQKPQRKAQLMELQRQLQAKQAEAHELLRKNSDLKRRQRVLGMVIQVREEQMRRLNILRTKPQELESSYGSFVQASRNPWTNSLSVEQLKNMNAAVAADMFAKYIQELSRLMGQMSQGSEAEVALALGGGASSSSSSGGRAQGSGSGGGSGRSQGRSQHASVITTQALAASSGTGSTAAAAGGTAAAAAIGGAGVTGGTPDDGGTAPSDPCAQMEELINEVREVTRYMQLVNPHYQAVLYDNGALIPPPGHWAQVLEAASLRDEQIADFLVLREIHNSLTAKVYRERRHLASQLQDALAVQLSSPATAELSAVTVARGKTTTAMERLHRNVLKERCLMFLTGETFYNAFDSDQLARLCLACYPHKPDEIALWDELARQRQLEG